MPKTALDLEDRLDRALSAGDRGDRQKEGPGRFPSPAPSTPEHPSPGEGRRSQARVWHDRRDVVDAVVEALGDVRGFRLTSLMAAALGARVAERLGPEALTEQEAVDAFSLRLYAGEKITADILADRAKNVATLAWLHLEYGRGP